MSSLFVRTKELHRVFGIQYRKDGDQSEPKARGGGGTQRIWKGVGRVRKRLPKEGILFNNPLLEESDRVILWKGENKTVTDLQGVLCYCESLDMSGCSSPSTCFLVSLTSSSSTSASFH
jgi:hypothetical protein